MSRPKDNPPSRDAGQQQQQQGEAGERKTVDKVEEAGKTQPAARRPRRKYDPVLQPPEKTRVP